MKICTKCTKSEAGSNGRCTQCNWAAKQVGYNSPEFWAVRETWRPRRKGCQPNQTTECVDCLEAKAFEEFYKVGDCVCKTCRVQRNRLQKYNISRDELDALNTGVCKICGTTDPGTQDFHIDHCHETDAVRGLLCNTCNLGLGYFKDNSLLLEAAAQYLKEAQHGTTKQARCD